MGYLFAGVTILLWSLPRMRGMLGVFRADMQDYFGISLSQFGLLLSIGSLPGVVGSLLGGRAVDRIGPRAVMRVCLIGTAAGMILVSLAEHWGFMIFSLCVLALFGPTLSIATHAYLVRLFPNRRRRVLAISMVVVSVMGGCFSLLAEGLLQLHRHSEAVGFGAVLHAPFAIVAVLLLLGSLVYTRRGATTGTDVPDVGLDPASGNHLAPGSILLVALLVTHTTFDVSAHIWMPRVLESKSFQEVLFKPGYVMFGFSGAYVVSRSLLSLLPEHRGRWVMMIAPSFLGAAALTAGLLSRSQGVLSVCYVLAGFLWSVEYPVILAILAERSPRRFGSAMAVQWVGMGLGIFAVTNLMGLLGQHLGEANLWKILFVPACGLPLVGLGGAVWVWRFGGEGALSTVDTAEKVALAEEVSEE
jgi:MFS family permease